MRDQFSTLAYLDERVASKVALCNKIDRNFFIERYLEDGAKNISFVIMHPIERVIVPLILKYGRGDDLDEIYNDYFKEMMVRYEYPVGLMRDGHPQKFIVPEDNYRLSPYHLHSVYTLMAFCLCFMDDFDQQSFEEFVTYLCPSGQDRLADIVRAKFTDVTLIADVSGSAKCFDILTKIVDASPAQRPYLVRQHLDNWPVSVAKMGFTSIGGSNVPDTAKTKGDLVAGMDDHYKGFWAWDVALVVKFFDIDDTTFRDNPFYPADLVHFRQPLNLTHDIQAAGLVERTKPAPPNGLVVVTDTPSQNPITTLQHYIRDEQYNFLYWAAVPRKGMDLNAPEFDEAGDTSIRYAVSVIPNGPDVDAYREDWDYIASTDDWLAGDRVNWTMTKVIDKTGTDDVYPFMLQSHLLIDVGVDGPAWVHTSRYKESEVPPLMVFRFLRFADDQMLSVDCMVRDDKVTFLDVKDHFKYLIDRYADVI